MSAGQGCVQGACVNAGLFAAVTEVTARLKGPATGHAECCLTPGWTCVGIAAATG